MNRPLTEESPASIETPPTQPAGDEEAKQAKLRQCETEISSLLAIARSATLESLRHYKSVGEKLTAAKKLVKPGNFIDWVEQTIGIKRKWSARLMKLAKHWHRIEPRFEDGRWDRLGYSVDEACSVINEILRSQRGETNTTPPKPARKTRSELEAQLREAEEKRNELQAQADSEIIALRNANTKLKSENEKLKEQLSQLRMSSGSRHLPKATAPVAKTA